MNRSGLLFALYLAQGLPFGFFSLALPVILRDAGLSLTAISALGLLALPWSVKFLWAPLLDETGSRRRWLLGLQSAAVALALLLTLVDPVATLRAEGFGPAGYAGLLAAAFAFNLVAASQDVLTDGLAVRVLGPRERGIGNGIQVGTYRLGMILGGGLLLWFYARAGWRPTFLAMAALLGLTVLPVLGLRDPPRPPGEVAPGPGAIALGWLPRLKAPGILTGIGVVVAYRFGDQMASALFGPFLADAKLGLGTIALMKGTVGSATSLAGAVLGGWFVYNVGRRTALLGSGLAQAACFGLYIAAAAGLGGVGLLWAATIIEGVISTMATVALFTLMMDAADPDHAGTDYTLLASAVVVVGTVAGIAGGLMADRLGYQATFIAGALLAAAGTLGSVAWLDRRPVGRVAEAWRPPGR